MHKNHVPEIQTRCCHGGMQGGRKLRYNFGQMACTGRLSGISLFIVISLLLLLFSAPATGRGQHGADSFLNADNIVDLLREEGNKWADVYLPTGVSPTSPCGRALQDMFADITNNTTLWAATMVDAWGKSSDGIVFGNIMFAGFYDECLSAASPDGKLNGKYCLVTTSFIKDAAQKRRHSLDFRLPRKLQAHWLGPLLRDVDREPHTIVDTISDFPAQYGTCMPNVCTEKELAMSVTQQNLMSHKTSVSVTCFNEEPEPQFTDADVGFMALITFLIAVIVCSSLVDMYLHYTGNKALLKGALRYLLVFSAYTNLNKILQVNPTPSSGTITCLNGMRVLSMTWVLYAHQQGTTFFHTANLFDVGKWTDGILAQTIANGFPSVDTFFFFSGLLVTYSILRELRRRDKFNVIFFLVHRFIRLIPPIAIVAGFMATVLRFFVSGPSADIWSIYWQGSCVKNWWKDILFVNNFFYVDGDCLAQAWYVAVDTQLYLIAPLVIVPLFSYEALGKAWLFIVTLVSAVIPAAIIYVYDYPPTSLIYQPEGSNEYFIDVYLTPWCRAEPWVAGVWIGYIFYKQGDKRIKMSALIVTVGWTAATITGLLVVYGLASYNRVLHPEPYEVMTQVVYGGGHRLAWGAALAWIVFACHNGYGGIVNDFLSHPIWQPISRLTYSIYLVAFPIQFLVAYNLRVAAYYTYVNKIIETVGSLVVAFPGAVLVSLMAESPVMGLEKLLLRPSSLPSKKTETSTTQPNKASEPMCREIIGGLRNPTFTLDEDLMEGEKKTSPKSNSEEHEREKRIADDTHVTLL